MFIDIFKIMQECYYLQAANCVVLEDFLRCSRHLIEADAFFGLEVCNYTF